MLRIARIAAAASLWIAAASPPTLAPPHAQAAPPRALVIRAIAAHGGAAKVARLRRLQWGGAMTATPPGAGEVRGTWRQTWQLPRQIGGLRVRDEQTLSVGGAPVTKVQVLDGDRAWVSENGQARAVQGAERAQMRRDVYPETLDKLAPLLDPGHILTALGQIEVRGRPALGVRVTARSYPEVRLYFDKASRLLIKRENAVQTGPGTSARLELFYSDYKDVGGVKLYGKASASLDGRPFEEFTVTDVKFLDKPDERAFAPPGQ